MKTSIKKIQNSIIELTIEETKENIIKHRKKVLENLRKNADIKWFRKWANIPENILVANYSEDRIYSMIIDEALNDMYPKALKENKIFPIAQWELKEVVSQDPLVIIMSIEVFPEIDIKGEYKNIKVKKTIVSVNDEEVEQALNQIQDRFTRFIDTSEDYQSQMWDKVNIDTAWFDLDGNSLENTSMQNYPITLWSNVLVPWFEESIVWKKVWDDFEIDVEFPTDYHNASFAWKKTKFNVKVNHIQKSDKPEFTQEFIKELRGKDLDLAWFKALIKTELLETKESNARLQDENALIDELLKVTTLEFGTSMLEEQSKRVYEEIKENIMESWAKVNDYISSLWLTEDEYKEKYVKPVAQRRLSSELILHKLQELEKVEVSDEEVKKEIEKIMDRYGSEEVRQKLTELYTPGQKYYEELKTRVWYRNLIDTFFE